MSKIEGGNSGSDVIVSKSEYFDIFDAIFSKGEIGSRYEYRTRTHRDPASRSLKTKSYSLAVIEP